MSIIATIILALAALAFAAWKNPSVGFVSVLVMFGFEQLTQTSHIIFVHRSYLINLAFGLVVLISIVSAFLRGWRPLSCYPVAGVLTILLFSFAFTSTLWTPAPEAAMDNWRRFWPYLVTIVLLSPLGGNKLEELNKAFGIFMWFGALVLLGLFFYSDWDGRGIAYVGMRSGARFLNPLETASLAAYVSFAAVCVAPKRRSPLTYLVRFAIVSLCMAVAFKSSVRGQGVLLVAGVLAGGLFSQGIKGWRTYFGWFLVAIVVFSVALYLFQSLGSEERWSSTVVEERVSGTMAAAIVMLDAWWSSGSQILIGLGNSAAFSTDLVGIYPHVVLIEVLSEEGLIGGLLLVTIIFLTCVAIRKLYIRGQINGNGVSIITLLGLLFMFEFALSFKQGSLLGSTRLFAVAILIGRLELLGRRQSRRSSVPLTSPLYSRPEMETSRGQLP